MSVFPFPDRPRLFGVAVSHYQVEGGDRCDWTDWEAAGRTKGGACGRAADSWERYEEDAALAAAAGANAFRFSVSWSRSSRGAAPSTPSALARYGRFVDRLVSLGLEPIVTLHHYTHPEWFHEETPWTSPASVDAFARFARDRRAGARSSRAGLAHVQRAARPPPRRVSRRPDPARPRRRPRRRPRPRPLLAAHAAAAAALRERRARRRDRPRAQHDGLRPGAAGLAARPPARRPRAPPLQRRVPRRVRERRVGPVVSAVHAPQRAALRARRLARLRRRELLLAPSRAVPGRDARPDRVRIPRSARPGPDRQRLGNLAGVVRPFS